MKFVRRVIEQRGGPTLLLGVEVNLPPKIVKVLVGEPSGAFSKYTIQYRVKDGVTCFVGLTKFSAFLFDVGLKGVAIQLSRYFVQKNTAKSTKN